MKQETLSLKQKVQNNRDSLKKQSDWAVNVSRKALTVQPVIEEHFYGNGERERLDFIYPKEAGNKKLPVLIYIHGGGWVAGEKEVKHIYLSKFAENGYFVVNIEYDLAPEQKFPYQIGQCAAAVDYFLDHAGDYPADVKKIAVAGESAGVFYACYVAAFAKDQTLLQKLGLEPMRNAQFDVKAVFSNCGGVDFKLLLDTNFPDVDLFLEAFSGYPFEELKAGEHDDILLRMNPMTHIRSDFPPTLLMYGSLDSLRTNTFSMQKRFDELDVPYTTYKCTGIFYGQHTTSFIFLFKKALRILDDVLAWLDHTLGVTR